MSIRTRSFGTAFLATGLALASTAVVDAAPATAQTAIFELSSGSSRGGSNIDYQMDPNDPSVQVPEQAPLGSAYTGSAPLSIALAVGLTAVAVQLVVDSVPQLRAAVDDVARSAGLEWVPGSSEGNRIFDVPAWIAVAQNLAVPGAPR